MPATAYVRALLLDRAEELGLARSGLPVLLEELARWLPTATLEAFLQDLAELSDCEEI